MVTKQAWAAAMAEAERQGATAPSAPRNVKTTESAITGAGGASDPSRSGLTGAVQAMPAPTDTPQAMLGPISKRRRRSWVSLSWATD